MENPTHFISVDLADVWDQPGKDKKFLRKLAWGDGVRVKAVTAKHVEIETVRFVERADGSQVFETVSGFIVPSKGTGLKPEEVVKPLAEKNVLAVDFVDVQQGDGSVIETPAGKVILIDGGDNQLFARYLAQRFQGSTADVPKKIDCVLISHGDADHFAGLTEIHESEQYGGAQPTPDARKKRLFIHPVRVYHNGLVKRPGTQDGEKRPEKDMLGATKKVGKDLVVTDLTDSLLDVPNAEMNQPFLAWKKALKEYEKRGTKRGDPPILFRRLKRGDDDAFGFLTAEGIQTEILGPLQTDAGGKPGLKFLGNPPKRPFIEGQDPKFTGLSASHTINGHSVLLRLRFGHFRFLFAGDLNHEAEHNLLAHHAESLKAEIFKVPHHGSADFSAKFIAAVSPMVSVISSGDESARKEFIHPRANLVRALGRFSRVDEPLIFVTELVAFFNVEGFIGPEYHDLNDGGTAAIKGKQKVVNIPTRKRFFSFSRSAFGIVKIRTDGKRLLVWTNSGQDQKKEVYAFTAEALGDARPADVTMV